MPTNIHPEASHLAVAEQLIGVPMPDPSWKQQAVCVNPPKVVQGIDLPPAEASPKVRNYQETRYIKRVCGRCAVQKLCFVDGVKSGAMGVVRGGQPSREVDKYAKAYQNLTAVSEAESSSADS